MKSKFIIVIVSLIAICIGASLVQSCSESDDTNKKIGAILPLTGGAAYLGNSVLVGMKIAFEDFNKKYGTSYELISYDTQSKLSNVNNIYQLIRSKNNPNLVLSWMSSVASNLVEITEKDSVLLYVGSAKPQLTINNNLVLRFWPNAIQLADIEANFITNYLKSKRVGIFFINDEYGLALADQISSRIQEANIDILFRETLSADITDYKNIITKYRNRNIDLVYIAAYDKTYSYLIKPLKQYLSNVKVLTDLTFCNYQTLKDFGSLSEGIYTIGTQVDNQSIQKEDVSKLRERVNRIYNREPDFNTALGYDMAWSSLEALHNTNGSPQKMKNYVIDKKNIKGMSGNIDFEKSGNSIFDLFLLKVKNGKTVEVKEF